ncbi:MAG: hypothetical protein EKK53_04170 [Burkholderiales bacterium]|nr:MAG: hypothetical protein EKK53_04170 [Burkholderiales bacterium]
MNDNAEKSTALVDVKGLGRVPIDLLLIEDAKRGLADVAAGRTVKGDSAIDELQRCRQAPARACRQ